MRVLVTGADGFVGSALLKYLQNAGHMVRAAVRGISNKILSKDYASINWINFDLDSEDNDYQCLLKDIDVVVHLASRVHITNSSHDDPDNYRSTNINGTGMLAQQAADFGVGRFIYLSTIKVNGECTGNRDGPVKFTEDGPCNPTDAYAISKYEAEKLVQAICAKSGMESVILRPPLVYGPGVKANFLQLLRIVKLGLPLPFSGINNSRSLIYLENLCDSILSCIRHEQAANQLFLVSDSDFSTPELIRNIAAQMGRHAHLISCPVPLLKGLAAICGRKPAMDRLTQSLLIDSSKIRNLLGWAPPYSSREGLRATVDWYLQR